MRGGQEFLVEEGTCINTREVLRTMKDKVLIVLGTVVA